MRAASRPLPWSWMRPAVRAEGDAAEAELFAVVGIDGQRRLEFAEAGAAGVEDDLEGVLAGGDVELALVV